MFTRPGILDCGSSVGGVEMRGTPNHPVVIGLWDFRGPLAETRAKPPYFVRRRLSGKHPKKRTGKIHHAINGKINYVYGHFQELC